jgi:hypothetical protein
MFAKSALFVAAFVMISASAQASVITASTTAGAVNDGLPVSAEAVFTTAAGSLEIVLRNLVVDPKSVSQNISGLYFELGAPITGAALTESSALERTLLSKGQYSDAGPVDTGWILSAYGNGLLLTVLAGPAAPEHTIIGSAGADGVYDKPNGSLANDAHNPFLAETARFGLNIPGISDGSSITRVQFLYGTTLGPAVPEPLTASMLLAGGVALVMWRKRRIA